MSDSVRVLIVGAGPAGAGLAYLLARCGIQVTLLERQRDFAREFRGEVLQASGVQALESMGLRDALAGVPAHTPPVAELYSNRKRFLSLELDPDWFDGRMPVAISQPGLLEMLVAEGEKHPGYECLRGATVRDVLRAGERLAGVRVAHADGEREIRCDLLIGTDGRASVVRKRAPVRARALDVPMDIVWCKVPCPDFVPGVRAYLGHGHLLIAYRTWDGSLQIGWVILKGHFGELKRQGIEHWVEQMADHVSEDLATHLRDHVDAVRNPFLLDCLADRVERWSVPGGLLLGDAAHVMSPVGGQGLNIALRDAIVAANHLVPALRTGDPDQIDAAGAAIEAERLPEVELIQRQQAVPPRIVLSRSWWGEPVRGLVAKLLSTRFGQLRAAPLASLFQFGSSEVELRV